MLVVKPVMVYMNDLFETLARVLLQPLSGDIPIFMTDHLDRTQLNYSMSSLKYIDQYLLDVRNFRLSMPTGEFERRYMYEDAKVWSQTVLQVGAYGGETLRRNSDMGWDWVTYDQFVMLNPDTRQYLGDSPTVATSAVLWASRGGVDMCLPLNKVARAILEEDDGNSMYLFAIGMA